MQLKRHFLQSEAWANFQKVQGNETFRIANCNYEISAVLKKTSFGNYLYCPYGPNIANFDGLKLCMNDLRELAKKTNSFFVRIEPTFQLAPEELKSLGFVKSADLNAQTTWVLDLDIDEKDLLAGIEKERTRYWRGREKRGMVIRTSKDPKDIDILYDFLKACADENGWVGETKEYLASELAQDFAVLYILELHEDDGRTVPLAASLMFDDETTRFYGHSANTPEKKYRKYRANGVLLVQAILDAKADGKEIFDFWGITTSDDENHPWAGFTRFKKSFGGRAVEYSGTWDLPISKFKYKTYTILRKINRTIRRMRYH